LDQGLAEYLPPAFSFENEGSSIDLRGLAYIEPASMRNEVLVAFARAIRVRVPIHFNDGVADTLPIIAQNVWIISTPCLGVALVVRETSFVHRLAREFLILPSL
jgi:hypothetical protein